MTHETIEAADIINLASGLDEAPVAAPTDMELEEDLSTEEDLGDSDEEIEEDDDTDDDDAEEDEDDLA